MSDDIHFRVGRRQFLRGSAGAILALPLMPSLLPRDAEAALARAPVKRLVYMANGHGAVLHRSMFPSFATLTQTLPYVGRNVRRGMLVPTNANGVASLSPVLSAPDTRLSAAIAAKMNVVLGFDIPFGVMHHSGGYLGNFAANAGNGGEGQIMQNYKRVTLDQYLASLPSFYRTQPLLPVVSLGDGMQVSWNYADPVGHAGDIVAQDSTLSARDTFSKIYVAPMVSSESPRTPVIDRILGNYRRLRQGNRRLSANDATRLDEHIARVASLQQRLAGAKNVDCSGVTPFTGNDPSDFVALYQLYNDVLMAAFTCGSSQIGVVKLGDGDVAAAGFVAAPDNDWHQDVVHRWPEEKNKANANPQALIVKNYQSLFANVFLDLALKLDATLDYDGKPMLDNSLVVWTQECGTETHDATSLPVITAGSAGGGIATGSFIDYRNYEPGAWVSGYGSAYVDALNRDTTQTREEKRAGLFYQQWLGVVLQAMGVSRAEFQTPQAFGGVVTGPITNNGATVIFDGDALGYGLLGVSDTLKDVYPAAVHAVRGEIPPFLTP